MTRDGSQCVLALLLASITSAAVGSADEFLMQAEADEALRLATSRLDAYGTQATWAESLTEVHLQK